MAAARKGFLFVSGVIVVAAPFVAIVMIANRGPGILEQSHFIEREGAPPALLVIDETGGTWHTYRLNVIDTHTGMRTQRVFANGIMLQVIGHDAKHLWTREVPSRFSLSTNRDARIEARDPSTLAIRIDQTAIERKNPGIARGIRAGYSTFDVPTGGLRVQSCYGDPFLIDGDRFTASPLSAPSAPAIEAERDNAGHIALPDGSFLEFSNGVMNYKSYLRQVNAAQDVYTPLHPDVTYQSPRFVIDTCPQAAATVDGTYFIVWKEVRGDFVTSVLSRISVTGESMWSRELPTRSRRTGASATGCSSSS